ncbi:Crp/Fnr family transcriptional regulator [Sphingomonas sp. AOB5]|uniref:Crp/Fnr family transcriptional regulator n=1 Tax=Sphingomonas sp. AOB5 TaxID=3034017 RepID=UPI0023F8F802|nr:Crp/Fnr family transcriptional regulator [Sphingomonas sp. AOB5]MDF7773642.1 Crp/Fnr family transcriptional regulator [Sphingomonas sp. AOB5]
MLDKHLMKLRARDTVSADEERVVRGLISETRVVPAKTTIIRAEQRLATSTMLLDGWMCRYKDLSNGQRQITALHIPGDFVDLHSFTLKQLDHNIMALTRCRIGVVPHDRLLAMCESHTHLTRLYWFATNMDAAIHREWELCLGRRTAIGRIAHILCEMHARLKLIGMTHGNWFAFPLTQLELSEATGLTPVHVNRMLKELRERGIAEVRGGEAVLHDAAALEALADFNPTYLYLNPEPQ